MPARDQIPAIPVELHVSESSYCLEIPVTMSVPGNRLVHPVSFTATFFCRRSGRSCRKAYICIESCPSIASRARGELHGENVGGPSVCLLPSVKGTDPLCRERTPTTALFLFDLFSAEISVITYLFFFLLVRGLTSLRDANVKRLNSSPNAASILSQSPLASRSSCSPRIAARESDARLRARSGGKPAAPSACSNGCNQSPMNRFKNSPNCLEF